METVIGGLFNAFAFSRANFLFSKLNHQGYKEETKRHDLAMEKLQRDKQAWYKKQLLRKEEISRLREEIVEANQDLDQTNKSLENLGKILNRKKKLENEYEQEERNEPKLENYYQPSQEMKEYQNVLFLVTGLTGGYLFHKLI